MGSALAFRVVLLYIFAVIGYMIITGGPGSASSLLSSNNAAIINAVLIILGLGAVGFSIAQTFSGVFIGAFVVISLIVAFQSFMFPALNPFGAPLIALGNSAPAGLGIILIVLGLLVQFATDTIAVWSFIDIFAG